MTDAEIAAVGAPVEHIPTVLGAVAITYNLPREIRPLRLTGETIAAIFSGELTRWNDARIATTNPKLALPALPIAVVHRTDASGTSYIMSDYLASVSSRWAGSVGRGRDVKWPVGIGGRGNEGVAGAVKQTVGAIGYVELSYARQNRLPAVHVRNRAGKFTAPMIFEISSAASSALLAPSVGDDDLRRSLVDAPGESAYPISSFTWMLVIPSRLGTAKTSQLAGFVRWALEDGNDIATQLGYVPLPGATAARVLERLDRLSPTAESRGPRTR